MSKQVTVTKAEVDRVVKAINMVDVQKHWPITEAQSELLDRLTQCYTKGRAFTMKDARERYLIARWGAEAKPPEELARDAKKRWLREKKAETSKKIKEAQAELSTAEEDATIKFNC